MIDGIIHCPYGTIVDNITFRNNVFYRVGIMAQDHGETQTNIKVYNNVFHTVGHMYYLYGAQRSFSSHAILFKSKTSGVEVKNNIFLNCGDEPEMDYKGCYSTNNAAGLILAEAKNVEEMLKEFVVENSNIMNNEVKINVDKSASTIGSFVLNLLNKDIFTICL
jgi:hypothetical protein